MHLDNLLCQIQANRCNLVHDFPSHPIDGGTSILALRCRLELGKSLPFAQPGRLAGGAGAPSARGRLAWFVGPLGSSAIRDQASPTMGRGMKRRSVLVLLGTVALHRPLVARAQQ